jgi:putative protein kinase ArgK-like GTPase of G3E family
MNQDVVITQADRNAAADIYRRFRYGSDRLQNNLLGGRADSDPITQIFAHHRTTALSASGVEEMAEALEEIGRDANPENREAQWRIKRARTALTIYRDGKPS